MGLSITKSLLHLMESAIQVESSPGKGSTFSFVLLMEEGIGKIVEQDQNKDTDYFAERGTKVLVVDDNRVNLLVASKYLKKLGAVVDTVETGEAALEKIKNKSYHIILMDLLMPGLDGYETTQRIRALDDIYYKEVPIIALTASAMNEIRDKALLAGMIDFISKPFQLEALKSTMARYIK